MQNVFFQQLLRASLVLLSLWFTPAWCLEPVQPNTVVNVTPLPPLNSLQTRLARQAPDLSARVLQLALLAAQQASDQGIANNQMLTVIDYSLPANVKRLWVFNLLQQKLMFHTYVAHGLGSGQRMTQYFSNQGNSHASSIGVFNTERSYIGSHGLAVRLFGLDPGINDQAARRAIVMHGAWYVDEAFIRRYGRPGRSWGCPAVPERLITPIVAAIQYGTLLVVYYPDAAWFGHSAFLQGLRHERLPAAQQSVSPPVVTNESIVFVDLDRSQRYHESKPVLVMSAAHYQAWFKQSPPLTRMLRRRIGAAEYIALTPQELVQLGQGKQHALSKADIQQHLRLVTTQVIRQAGFYHTRLRVETVPAMTAIEWSRIQAHGQVGYVVLANQQRLPLMATNQFIRWIGL